MVTIKGKQYSHIWYDLEVGYWTCNPNYDHVKLLFNKINGIKHIKKENILTPKLPKRNSFSSGNLKKG
jgi:hypothetical protein